MTGVAPAQDAPKREWALWWAATGRRVHPVKGKNQPYLKEWQTKASADPEQVGQWWDQWPDANPAGCCDDWAVIDTDPRNGGIRPAGLPPTREHLSGRGDGGSHLVYQLPPGVTLKSGKLAPGVDLKTGPGAYVLLPGSTHPDTDQRYTIKDARSPASWPVELGPAPRTRSLTLDELCEAVRNAPNGERDETFNRMAYKGGQLVRPGGVTADQVRQRLGAAARENPHPLNDDVITEKLERAVADGMSAEAALLESLVQKELRLKIARADAGRQFAVLEAERDWRPLTERRITREALNRPPAEQLVGQVLYADNVSLAYGAEGAYKTFVAVGLACSVALGRDWGPHRVPQAGQVVFVAAEGGRGIRWRIEAWALANGVDPAALDENLAVYDSFALGSDLDLEDLRALMIERHTALLVFDTKRRVSGGFDENSNSEQELLYRRAEQLQRASGAAALMLHHPNKSGSDQSGAGTWATNAWMVTEITRPEPLRAVWRQRKTKEAECRSFAFDLVPQPIPDTYPHRPLDVPLVAVPGDLPTSRDPDPHRGASHLAKLEQVREWLLAQYAETGRVPGRPNTQRWCQANDVNVRAEALGKLISELRGEVGL